MIALLAASFVILTTTSPNIAVAKNEITKVVYEANPSDKEKAALLIAIASIETENMAIDYPTCDNKTGDACNVGIFKMNLYQQKRACPKTTQNELQTNIAKATQCMLTGINKYGTDQWLSWHRGGEGWVKHKDDVRRYKNAIKALADKYLNTKGALNDKLRFTIAVRAI